MRTTIDLPDDLLRRAKAEAALAGISLKDYFTQALEAKIEQKRKKRLDRLPTVPIRDPKPFHLSPEQIDESAFG